MTKVARGRGIDHDWRDCGDGYLVADTSPWTTTRLIWIPQGDGQPVVRYAHEADYPASDHAAALAWAASKLARAKNLPFPVWPSAGSLSSDHRTQWDRLKQLDALIPYSAAQHHYQGLGDGRILITQSPVGTWRFLWVGHTAERPLVLRTGRERDYPANGTLPRLLGWAAAQPWGLQTSPRPFEAARLAAEGRAGAT